MAKISIHGMELHLSENDRRAKGIDKHIRKMLKEGAAVVVRTTSAALDGRISSYTPRTNLKRNRQRTGTLKESIGAGSVRKTDDGVQIEIYPQGERTDKYHKTPARNAAIGFVVEYGARGVPARGFMADGREDSAQEVNELWGRMMDEYHRKSGSGTT